jgi:hypothetical protein
MTHNHPQEVTHNHPRSYSPHLVERVLSRFREGRPAPWEHQAVQRAQQRVQLGVCGVEVDGDYACAGGLKETGYGK